MDSTGPIIIAGALVGFAVGLTGMGGGALMTPIMVMVFGVNPTAAIGSDLAASVFMKPFGALVHHRAGTVRWDIVRWLLPTAVPAAFGGVFLLRALGDGDDLQQRVKYGVGTALLLAVVGGRERRLVDAPRYRRPSSDPPLLRSAPPPIRTSSGPPVLRPRVRLAEVAARARPWHEPALKERACDGTDCSPRPRH